MSSDVSRHPDGEYITWATKELEEKYGYKILDFIRDQHSMRLGAVVESPSGKRGRLLVGGWAVKGAGYAKSLDAEVVLKVIAEDDFLLLGLRDEKKFYMTDAESLSIYLDTTDRIYNGHRSLRECFSASPPWCPICPKRTPLNRWSHKDHPASPYAKDLIEVHNWRIKFCNVPLREADFVNIDRTVGPRPSFYERWFYAHLKKAELPFLRTAEFRDPVIKKQFGYYPDFIPLKGNLVLEVDISTKKKTIEERRSLLSKLGYRLFSITNLPKIKQEYDQGNTRKLHDLLNHIKTLLEEKGSLLNWIEKSETER